MKRNVLLATLTLMSFSAFADVDYSKCMTAAGLWGTNIDKDGNFTPHSYQKIVNKSSEGKVDRYEIESEFPNYGGTGSTKHKTLITLEKDDQGRVVKVQTGGDKMDKKSIETMKKFQLQGQVNMTMMNANIQNGQFGYGLGPFGEMTYAVKDKDAKIAYKKLSELNKEERAQVGMSEELYKEMKQKARLDKKSSAKIEKGLKDLQAKSTPVYYLGQEAELEFKDGVCSPKNVSQRLYHTKDGTVHKNTTFTKEGCEEVQKLFVKHRDSIAKCDQSKLDISKDIYQNHDKIKDIMAGQGTFGYAGGYGGGMVGGMGGGYVAGSGGGYPGGYMPMGNPFGDYGSLTYMKSYCDMMVGEMKFGYGGGFGIPTSKPEDASKQ